MKLDNLLTDEKETSCNRNLVLKGVQNNIDRIYEQQQDFRDNRNNK